MANIGPLIASQMESTDIDIDQVIARLLEVRGARPGKQVQLAEYEIKFLCTKAREIFINQPILLELEAPIKICGRSGVRCGSSGLTLPR